jgi:hypothetical protein
MEIDELLKCEATTPSEIEEGIIAGDSADKPTKDEDGQNKSANDNNQNKSIGDNNSQNKSIDNDCNQNKSADDDNQNKSIDDSDNQNKMTDIEKLIYDKSNRFLQSLYELMKDELRKNNSTENNSTEDKTTENNSIEDESAEIKSTDNEDISKQLKEILFDAGNLIKRAEDELKELKKNKNSLKEDKKISIKLKRRHINILRRVEECAKNMLKKLKKNNNDPKKFINKKNNQTIQVGYWSSKLTDLTVNVSAGNKEETTIILLEIIVDIIADYTGSYKRPSIFHRIKNAFHRKKYFLQNREHFPQKETT